MTALHQLTDDLLALEELLEQSFANGSEDDIAEIVRTLEEAEGALESKIDGYARLLRHLDAMAAAAKAEERRVGELRKAREAKRDRLKRALLEAMQRLQRTRVETPTAVVTVQRNGGKAPLVYEPDYSVSRLPDDVVRIEMVADTDAIRERLMAGREIPGVRLGDLGTHLRIR